MMAEGFDLRADGILPNRVLTDGVLAKIGDIFQAILSLSGIVSRGSESSRIS